MLDIHMMKTSSLNPFRAGMSVTASNPLLIYVLLSFYLVSFVTCSDMGLRVLPCVLLCVCFFLHWL